MIDKNEFFSPSTYKKEPWIYIRSQVPAPEGNPENSGKWLVFATPDKIDKIWRKISIAVYHGQLGTSAKVSTPLPNQPEREQVICVYTYDYTDKEDVMRVRQRLKELGITRKIPYKTDNATRAGKYSQKGERVSLYWE